MLSSINLGSAPRYADLGSGNGWLTAQVAEQINASTADAFDVTPIQLEDGRSRYPQLAFHSLNLNESLPEQLKGRYDFVTCLETLEHLGRPAVAIRSAIEATRPGGTAMLTVPIETGVIGTTKFLVKGCYGLALRDNNYFTDELAPGAGTWWRYLSTVVAGGDISAFRDDRDRWGTHFGFDYRMVDRELDQLGVQYDRRRVGSSVFYIVPPP